MKGNVYSLGENSYYNPIFIFKIMKYIGLYDLVHVHLFPALYFVSIAKYFGFSKTPIIFTEHNTYNRRITHFLFNKIDRVIYRGYANIVCITDEIKAIFFKRLNFPEKRFTVIKNGINIDFIKKAVPYDKSELLGAVNSTAKLLIQVSRFDPQKDQFTLIKAIKYLHVDVHLILVGDGPLKYDAEVLVKDLGLEDRVHFLGIRMDVPKLLKSADVVVLSSKYEGLSLSSIEGLASGKPFVGSNVPGLKEIIDGAGMCFEAGNDRQLADVIRMLLENGEESERIAELCMLRSSEYDIYKMVDGYISLYKDIIFSK